MLHCEIGNSCASVMSYRKQVEWIQVRSKILKFYPSGSDKSAKEKIRK